MKNTQGLKKYKYYLCNFRGISIDTCPKQNLLYFEEYDDKKMINEINRTACGELYYSKRLNQQQIKDYELKEAPCYELYEIRPLQISDENQLNNLDKEGNIFITDAYQIEDNVDFSYGIFLKENKRLIGVCTIGGAEGIEIEGVTEEDYILSDLFITPEFRGYNLAEYLIQYVIKEKALSDKVKKAKVYFEVYDIDAFKNYYRKRLDLYKGKIYNDGTALLYREIKQENYKTEKIDIER